MLSADKTKLLQNQFEHGNEELTLSEMALKAFKHTLCRDKEEVDPFTLLHRKLLQKTEEGKIMR